jgi:hypothetical protein
MYPWEKHQYGEVSYGTVISGRWLHLVETPREYEYHTITQYLDDNPMMALRKGDIVLFSDGLLHRTFFDWRDWFLTEEDKLKHSKKDPAVPYYARNQLAIIIGRYRKVKYKYQIFKDYGLILMMLSGNSIGHVKRYFGIGCSNPLTRISKFPELPQEKKMLEMLPEELIEIYKDKFEDTNESRNHLVSTVYHQFKIYDIYKGEVNG